MLVTGRQQEFTRALPHPMFIMDAYYIEGFSGRSDGKESARMCEAWVRKIPRRRAWQPISVFLSGESPWTEEPGGLQSMGSQRGRHD